MWVSGMELRFARFPKPKETAHGPEYQVLTALFTSGVWFEPVHLHSVNSHVRKRVSGRYCRDFKSSFPVQGIELVTLHSLATHSHFQLKFFQIQVSAMIGSNVVFF